MSSWEEVHHHLLLRCVGRKRRSSNLRDVWPGTGTPLLPDMQASIVDLSPSTGDLNTFGSLLESGEYRVGSDWFVCFLEGFCLWPAYLLFRGSSGIGLFAGFLPWADICIFVVILRFLNNSSRCCFCQSVQLSVLSSSLGNICLNSMKS